MITSRRWRWAARVRCRNCSRPPVASLNSTAPRSSHWSAWCGRNWRSWVSSPAIHQIRARRIYMKVLVTGATGFVGREIVRGLPRAGHETHILTRDGYADGTQAAERELSAQIHFGNNLNPDSIQRGVRGIDALFHLVVILSEVVESTF